MTQMNISASVSMVEGLYQSALVGKHTDFRLIAGDTVITCHKMVLCAQSEFFDAIVNTGVSEYDFGVDSVMAEEDGSVLAGTLRFLYLGTLGNVADDSVEWFVEAADLVEYPKLRNHCEKLLLGRLNIENCRSYEQMAERQRMRNLKNKCLQMANGELE